LPEVVGDAGLYIDVNNYESTLPYIEVLLNQDRRKEIIAKGVKQASKFSWTKTAKETINVYKELLDN